ncbi:squalene synthase HpnC [Amycolatopsis jiangsuensis]|uniref:Squalene synthase HpnC n=1 Tax=Amycolatopsis jiangsuensis TaxID=1181879 RepID=A0A840IPB9_9PSEU|nr:squalene synthase HpnC [Amycolatopsis jiangsuensis]MBB4684216.1 squalene synthase HpnC [Amycolatopsis jiangsuensis]
MTSPSPGRHSPDADGLRAKRRAENFPVALRILPRQLRGDLVAVYGVARTIDDLGDEAEGDRVARLEAFAAELSATFGGTEPADPALRALVPVIRDGRVAEEPFRHLVEANLQDQHVLRYPGYPELRQYCRLSADPVGRIVLSLLDVRDERAAELSDRICTGLQLVEHWQDVGEDYRAGRVYLPQEDLAAFGVEEDELGAAHASPRLKELMRWETDRAAALLGSGADLVALLPGWGRLAVSGFLAGGLAAVDALRESRGDVLGVAVRPSRAGVAGWLGWLQVSARTGRRSG